MIEQESKVCSKCKVEKPVEIFSKDKSREDGLCCCCKSCFALHYEAHKEQRATYQRQWDEAHKKERNSYIKERRLRDPNYKIARLIRRRLYDASRGGFKAGSGVKDMGCPPSFPKIYIESLFWPGMTWENQGFYGWHVDHVVPLISFDLTNREQFLKANHYTNLQPLWGDDNLNKKHRLDWSPLESEHELPERFKERIELTEPARAPC